jgi:hypothetical protein
MSKSPLPTTPESLQCNIEYLTRKLYEYRAKGPRANLIRKNLRTAIAELQVQKDALS